MCDQLMIICKTVQQGRQKQIKSGSAFNTEVVRRPSILRPAQKKELIELSGSSSQHEDAQLIHIPSQVRTTHP